MDDTHRREGELDGSGLERHEGGVSCQTSRDQLDPSYWYHAVGGAGGLLGVQGEVTKEMGLCFCPWWLGEDLRRKVSKSLGGKRGGLSAAVHGYA